MIRAMMELLGNFYANNDLSNFEIIARSINSSVPGETISLLFIGLARYRRGHISDAIELFDKVARRPPLTRASSENDSHSKTRKEKSPAITSFIEATRNSPQLAQVWCDLGTALRNVGNHEGAIRAYQTAAVAKPEFADAIFGAGSAALAAGDLKLAKDSFLRLRSLQPNNEKAYLGLGMAYRKLRDFASAHACFIRARMLMNGTKGIEGLAKTRNNHRRYPANSLAFSESN